MIRVTLSFFLWFISPAAPAPMYRCVDERGVTHYSDQPRPGCKGSEVDIRSIPPVSGQTTPRSEDFARDEAAFKRRQIERDSAEAKDQAELERRCALARREIARLDGGRRVVQVNEQGERSYLDDATRDRRLAKLREELRGCP
jgi:hypothetical protein